MKRAKPIGAVLALIFLATWCGVSRAASSADAHGLTFSQIPKAKISVRPLDLTRTPSTDELMAAGQLGGILYPTHELQDTNRARAARIDFGAAIEKWNRHEYSEAVELFRRHAKDFSDSPWVAEATLHIGCDATYNGRYIEAEAIFTQLIAVYQNDQNPGAKMMLNKARQRLALVKVEESNLEEANRLFLDLQRESPDWKHRTYATHWLQRLSRFAAAKEALLNCGADALAYVLKKDGHQAAADLVQKQIPHSMRGHSISELVKFAADQGYEMAALHVTTSDLEHLPLPAVVHISEGKSGDKGHYWVLDKVQGSQLELYDPQSGHRFHQTADELAAQWSGDVLVFSSGNKLPGRKLDPREMEEAIGGCCGAPHPQDNLGSPGDGGGGGGGCRSGCCGGTGGSGSGGGGAGSSGGAGGSSGSNLGDGFGSPIWQVNMINMNFFVTDTPMWYDPPFGPPIRISLSYNSQSAISHNEPFGNKWIFNYGGYLIMDTSGNVTIFMPDGRQDVYTPNGAGGYNPPLQVYNRLLQIAPNHFELHFPEGTVYVYQIPPGTTSQQPFLTEIDDAYGQKLTLGYNATVQLTTLTDAQGKVFTLSYNPVGLVTNVADPFGRNASFQYDGNNNLRQITDMGGYWSTFSYDANVFMTSIGDARGTTGFYTEVPGPSGANSDNYPPPGDPNMFQNYRITVTNALGYREEFMYYAGCDQDGYNGCAGYSWHVGPRDYIPWQSQSVNNYRSRAPKIRYIPTHVGSGQVGKLAEILNPLADYILYGYDTTTGNRISVTDAHGHVRRYTYNSLGLLTSLTDSQGTPISFIYSTNSVDLLSISNAVGQIAAAYNPQHDITSLSSRLTNTSTVAYNSYGQIAQRVNALGITNQYLYDINGRLSAITRSGYTMETFTYDALGRVKTFTDSSGLTITNDYNNLNHLTRRTYRDERSEIYTYSSCCPNLLDSYTDRAGRTTTYIYDAMKRLVQIMNPETGAIQFAYDPNGNLVQLTDPNNNRTTLTYDLDNRLTGQIFPDGKGITYTYDGAGLVKTRTNGRGIVATYGYDANHNITSRSYSDGTPAITNIYDTFNRVTNVLDVIGSNVYTYDADSRLIAADGPWPNDGITYAYDSINQLTNISAQGGQSFGYIFDALDRLSSLQRGAALYNFTYVGQSRMVQRLSRPNGSYSDYAYDDLERLTGVTNKQSSGQVISGFSYTYNSADQRDSETVSNSVFVGPSTNQVVVYSYNGLNQILTSAPPSQIFGYDADGNMTKGVLPGGSVFTAAYDAENRLASVIYTNAVGVTCSNQYFYGGRGLLSQTRSYTNGILANDTRFVRSGYLVIQERDSSNLTTRDYAWSLARPGGIGCLLGMVQAGNEYSYAFDGKGNVSAITDSAQGVAAAYSYDPFGLLLSSAGYLQQPYRFSTKAVDSNTGIIDFGYRRYLPGADRWMSRDPLADTTTLSLYTYVLNNPINRVDPYGLADDGNGNNPGFIDYPASFIGGPCCGPGYDCSNPNNPRRNDPSPGNQACLRHDVALHNSGAPWTDLTNPDVYNTHLNLGKEHPSPVFKVIFCTLGTVGKTTRSVEDSINDTWSKIWNDFNNFVGYPSGGDPFFQ